MISTPMPSDVHTPKVVHAMLKKSMQSPKNPNTTSADHHAPGLECKLQPSTTIEDANAITRANMTSGDCTAHCWKHLREAGKRPLAESWACPSGRTQSQEEAPPGCSSPTRGNPCSRKAFRHISFRQCKERTDNADFLVQQTSGRA